MGAHRTTRQCNPIGPNRTFSELFKQNVGILHMIMSISYVFFLALAELQVILLGAIQNAPFERALSARSKVSS